MCTDKSAPLMQFLQALADDVLSGRLSREEALARAAAAAQNIQIEDCTIKQCDECIRTYANSELEQAMQIDDRTSKQRNECIRTCAGSKLERAAVLAMLNCQVARDWGGDIVWGTCNRTLAGLYLRQSELELALYHYQQALEAFEPIPAAQEAVVQLHLHIGRVYGRQGQAAAARAAYETARAKATNLYPHLESDTWSALGYLDLAEGRADAAIESFERALAISREIADWRGREAALGNLGLAAHFLGRLDEAATYHGQALELSREHGHSAGTMRHRSHLGSIRLERGRFEEAEQYFRDALAIAVMVHDRAGEQQQRGNLGSLFHARGKTIELQRQSQEHHCGALAIARERNDRRSQAEQLTNLGSVLEDLGRFAEARAAYAEALKLAVADRAADIEWRAHYGMGKLDSAERGPREALDHYNQAIAIVERQRGWLVPKSRSKFWQEKAILYKCAALESLRLCADDPAQLWQVLEYTERTRARYLADLLSKGAEPTADTRATIAEVLKALPSSLAVVIFNVTEAGTIVLIVTNRPAGTARESSDNPATEPGDTWYVSSDQRIRGRLIKQFKQQYLKNLLIQFDEQGNPVGGYLGDYYISNDLWCKTTLQQTCAEVYTQLLSPVDDELNRMKIEQVVLMPNLGLSLLPLHACERGNKPRGRSMLDRYEISYAPSFDILRRSIQLGRSRSSAQGWLLAIANPSRDLPWADVEVALIAERLQPTHVLDNSAEPLPPDCRPNGEAKYRANKATALTIAPEYEYLHFACHGQFDLHDSLKSTLKLADDPLSLEEIMSQLDLPRTRLVVMSACETGLVDPGDLADEFVTLPGGFLLASAPVVVASLWKVQDFSTALLMERFYQCHLVGDPDRPGEGPLPPARALQRAQMWMRDSCSLSPADASAYLERLPKHVSKPSRRFLEDELESYVSSNNRRPFSHPMYWAAFSITGL